MAKKVALACGRWARQLCPEVSQILDLKSIRGRKWKIMGASVYQNKGLNEGFDWLRTEIKKNKGR